ncbi:MAG: tyrosine--tRNA ligase [bacterium]|nr:tyrosine--tRNA ligase [bacterium]MCP5069925.1 tyrosine--tRNA ligase [bacterium]
MGEGAESFIGVQDLRPRLATAIREDRPLRIKLGMDPSAPDLHIGHTIVLEKLRVFQELGHTPIFLVGDFTARIGDPTGKKKTRPALEEDAIRRNAQTYVDQVSHVLDTERAEIRFNGEWMDAMSPADLVRLCSHYTVARMLERDDFDKRYKAGEAIAVHEFLYPLVQAYDSVALRADVELGGTDQTFNLLVGREIQRAYGQLPQAVITHPLLVGTDGTEKMSKSVGNTIGIRDAPEEIYGRAMSISDELMGNWVAQLGFGGWGDLTEAPSDPLATKKELAARLVARFHGEAQAGKAAEHFRSLIQRKETPDDLPEVEIDLSGAADLGLLDALRGALGLSSNSEARRLVTQGGARLDGEVVRDPNFRLSPGSYLVQAGKRRFARLRLR